MQNTTLFLRTVNAQFQYSATWTSNFNDEFAIIKDHTRSLGDKGHAEIALTGC